jgi:hypothetical protein
MILATHELLEQKKKEKDEADKDNDISGHA